VSEKKSVEKKTFLWPLDKLASIIGNILLSPFKPPEK
jgi:hypothetical protein